MIPLMPHLLLSLHECSKIITQSRVFEAMRLHKIIVYVNLTDTMNSKQAFYFYHFASQTGRMLAGLVV